MEMVINGVRYESIEAMRECVPQDVVDFLQEWYNEAHYVMGHTSGSTGKPKAIKLLKSDMKASACLTNDYLQIDKNATLLLCLSPSYIAGKMMIVRALEAHAALRVVEPSSAPLHVVDEAITLAAMVPMQVAGCIGLPDGEARLSRIEKLLIGGAPVEAELEQRLMRLPTQCYVTYGMTETVSHVAVRRVGEPAYEALGSVTFTTDERGCLVINAPQLSGKTFVTNDIVLLSDARHFVWQGRYDNVIMSGGLKFCAEVLEQKIEPLIARRYYITSAPDERLGERIVLVIEGDPYDETALEELQQAMSRVLSRYELPREIRFIPQVAMTASQKIIRR